MYLIVLTLMEFKQNSVQTKINTIKVVIIKLYFSFVSYCTKNKINLKYNRGRSKKKCYLC